MSAVAAAIGVVGSVGGAIISSGAAGRAAAQQAQAATEAAKIQAASADKATASQLAMYHQTRSDLQPFMTGGSNAFGILANIFGFGGGSNATATAAFGAAPAQPQSLTPEQSQNAQFDPTTGQITGYTDPTTGQFVAGHGDPQTGMFTPTSAQGQTSPLAQAGAGQPNPQLATDLLTKMPGYQFGLDQGVQALDRSAASRGRLLSGAQLQAAQKFGQGYAMENAWQPFISELNWAAGTGENAAAGAGSAATATGQGVANTQLAGGAAGAQGVLRAGDAAASGTAASGNAWGGAFQQLGTIASSYANRNSSPSFNFSSAGAPDMTSALDFSNSFGGGG